jgi:hypothetical protein
MSIIYYHSTHLTLLHFTLLAAFSSLLSQIHLFYDLNLPTYRLAKIKQFYNNGSILSCFMTQPTVLWFVNNKTSTTVGLCYVGIIINLFGLILTIFSLLLLDNQTTNYSWFILFLSYLIYLSLDVVFDLHLPWDMALLEHSFLSSIYYYCCCCCYDTNMGNKIPLMMLQFHFPRLMFGFAKTKFQHMSIKKSHLYIRDFLVAMPLPNWVGLLLHAYCPRIFHQFSLVMMACTEIIGPLLPFIFPSIGNWICIAMTTQLMIGINLTGSFGHFNILTITMTIPLLFESSSSPSDDINPLYQFLFFSPYCCICLLQLGFFSSATSTSWAFIIDILAPPLSPGNNYFYHPRKWLPQIGRLISSFRICNSYGVFPPHSFFPGRAIPLLEITYDNIIWIPLQWQFLPNPDQNDEILFPPGWYFHTPRLDMKIFYLARGMNFESLPSSFIVRGDNPWAFNMSANILDRLIQGILNGSSSIVQGYFGCHRYNTNTTNNSILAVRCSWSLVVATISPGLQLPPNCTRKVRKWYTFISLPESSSLLLGGNASSGAMAGVVRLNHDVLDRYLPEPILFQWCTAKVWWNDFLHEECRKFMDTVVEFYVNKKLVASNNNGEVLYTFYNVARWDQDCQSVRLGKVMITLGDVKDALEILSATTTKNVISMANDFGFNVDGYPKNRRILIAALMMLHGCVDIQEQQHHNNDTNSKNLCWNNSFLAYEIVMNKINLGTTTTMTTINYQSLWERLYPLEAERERLFQQMNQEILDPLNYNKELSLLFKGWLSTTSPSSSSSPVINNKLPFIAQYHEENGNWSLLLR